VVAGQASLGGRWNAALPQLRRFRMLRLALHLLDISGSDRHAGKVIRLSVGQTSDCPGKVPGKKVVQL